MAIVKRTVFAALAVAALAAPMSAHALCTSKVTFKNQTGEKIKVLEVHTRKNAGEGWRKLLGLNDFEINAGQSVTKKLLFARKPKKHFTVRGTADKATDRNRYYVYYGEAHSRCKHGHTVTFTRVLSRGS